MASRLQEIVDAHRAGAVDDQRNLEDLLAEARSVPPARDFAGTLQDPGLGVIAEVKRRSPSAGALNEGLDPASLAKEYEAGGASCISVLTDEAFFGGSVADLQAVRNAVSLPVLRKDFTVDARDVADARIMGADAILLIVAVLTDDELTHFHALATELGMAVLVEAHDVAEVQRAANIGARIIGVNQRNLVTFEVDGTTATRLKPLISPDVISVAESAITSVAEAHALGAVGYDAVLMGTALVTGNSPRQMLQEITSR